MRCENHMIGQTPPTPSQGDAATPTDPQARTGTAQPEVEAAREIGGRDGPEPTRFGDWEKNGRCIDF
ncbi:MAG: DUF1674 domain-containing protein [Lysobacteraceae bacterium]|nr:MAG: DUF1674 domain-containing protein [Xanthomonadaceae bacterium]